METRSDKTEIFPNFFELMPSAYLSESQPGAHCGSTRKKYEPIIRVGHDGPVFPSMPKKKPRAPGPVKVKFNLRLPAAFDLPASRMSKETKSWIDDVLLPILIKGLLT